MESVISDVSKTIKPHKAKSIIANTIIYIILGLFVLCIVVPVCWAVMSSFKTKPEFTAGTPWALPTQLYFTNYVNAWVEAKMGSYFLNTIIITFTSLVILLVVSVPCAYVLTRFKFRFNKFLNILMLAGIFINVNYIVVPLFSMFSEVGSVLKISGFTSNWFLVSVVYAGTNIAFSVYLMTGYFYSLSPAFEEAAAIDGCGYFKMLIKIIVPLVMPSIVIVVLFSFLKFWNEYLIAATFLMNPKAWTLSIGLLDLMEVEKLAGDRGRMFAGLNIVMIPTIIFFILVQDKLTKGITIGGVKG